MRHDEQEGCSRSSGVPALPNATSLRSARRSARFAVAAALIAGSILTACGGGNTGVPGYSTALPSTVGKPAKGTGTMVIVNGDNLWTVRADGSHPAQLTHETNGNFANNPVFSPDGRLIAYAYHVAPQGNSWGGSEIHVMHVDGTDDRVLVPAKAKGERAENPAWAPDGKSIYFGHDIPIIDQSNRYTGDTTTIDRVDLATSEQQGVLKDAIFPAISRSGTFAWVDYNMADASFKLVVGRPDGSAGRVLLTQQDFQAVYSPEVSPHGNSIIFSGSGRTGSKVPSAANPLAVILNPLVPGVAQAHGLPWDPWIINADGSGLRKLVSMGSDEQALVWSPDGKEVALANLSATYLMRADGTGFTKLLAHGDPGGLDWIARTAPPA